MGFIIETNIAGLGLERRRESFYIYEDSQEQSEHIFTYGSNGIVEISKEFLSKLLDYFNKHPEELKDGISEKKEGD